MQTIVPILICSKQSFKTFITLLLISSCGYDVPEYNMPAINQQWFNYK